MLTQVFISYAHADDQRYDEETLGWVTNLVEKLKNVIGMQLGGSQVDCWMDHRLEPQRSVDDALRQRIQNSACILAFMSPRYLESPWCQKEMATFVELVGGGQSSNRVFLVELLPTERTLWQSGVRDISEIRFWSSSLDEPEPIILGWPAPNPKSDRPYWNGISKLAAILVRQIQNLPPIPEFSPAPQSPDISYKQSVMPPMSGPLRLIINADKPDRELGKQVQKLLDDLEVDAILLAERPSNQLPAEYRKDLEALLADSDGVLIVYGSAPATWAQTQYSMTSKVLAMRSQVVWGGLLDCPPADKPDHDLPIRRLKVLDCRQGLSSAPLQEFIEMMRQAAGHV